MLVTNFNFKYFIYKIILSVYQVIDLGIHHPVRERARRALHKTVDYIESNLPEAMGFETQKELTVYALREVRVEGEYIECGVFSGGTIRFIAKNIKDKIIHGFDSFEGLPEEWHGFILGKNAFSRGGRLPKVPQNVILHKGWFKDTLPKWSEQNSKPICFLHIDCDLYSSTKEIFNVLGRHFREGTVILFDEYFNYPNWENHEYKAWQEFVQGKNVKYHYLGYARQQVAIVIDSIGVRRK